MEHVISLNVSAFGWNTSSCPSAAKPATQAAVATYYYYYYYYYITIALIHNKRPAILNRTSILSITLMKSIMPGGMLVLLSRPRYSMMSSVCKPTDTAAYSEYGVNLYSCMCSGRHTGCYNTHFTLLLMFIMQFLFNFQHVSLAICYHWSLSEIEQTCLKLFENTQRNTFKLQKPDKIISRFTT